MFRASTRHLVSLIGVVLCAPSALSSTAVAGPWDPTAADYSGPKGKTVYVSKLGDNSDGSSWAKAFHTIQAGVQAVPDDGGGHRVLVRPDTYVEANIYTSHCGVRGAYNALVGDVDGSLGSGAAGWVVIDSSCPGVAVRMGTSQGDGNPPFRIVKSDLPESGLKCVDWWGAFRTEPSFSAIMWDRWIFRGLYVCGSEGSVGWDLTSKNGSEFSAVVENCVGVGRFAGACVIGHIARKDEPVIFQHSCFMNLDVWGDAGGAYVRAHEVSMPDYPDAVFEDCMLVSPDNALQIGYPNFKLYTRVKLKDCRLIVLNFSQPRGTPSSGIICSDVADQYAHVDLEDCTLMGFKVFGKSYPDLNKVNGAGTGNPSYTVKGEVQAYVQYEQPLPKGFQRLGLWPTDLFNAISPPQPSARPADAKQPDKKLTKLPEKWTGFMENTPVIFSNRPLLVLNHRDDTKNNTDEYVKSMYLLIRDLSTREEIARFGEGHSFVNAFVEGPVLHIFASEGTNHDWFQSIYHFTSTDLKTWDRQLAIPRGGNEHLFNCSVCRDEQGYLMAYESNEPVQFCFKFARSTDLTKWEKIEGLVFAGRNGKEYSACPVIRYFKPYYYVVYTHAAIPGHNGWISFLARSKDLTAWELCPRNPMLEAGPGEGCNNSDVDLFEWEGSTYLYYATGDQQTWGDVRVAMVPGPMQGFFQACFPEGAQMATLSARAMAPPASPAQ